MQKNFKVNLTIKLMKGGCWHLLNQYKISRHVFKMTSPLHTIGFRKFKSILEYFVSNATYLLGYINISNYFTSYQMVRFFCLALLSMNELFLIRIGHKTSALPFAYITSIKRHYDGHIYIYGRGDNPIGTSSPHTFISYTHRGNCLNE